MTVEEFVQSLAQYGIILNSKQIQQFERYFELLIEWNSKINLTAITDKQEVYLKHFYDSILPLWEVPLENYDIKVCDVGAGAGFPSIPMKIIHPELNLTIIDSLNKRIKFLDTLRGELELDSIQLVHSRAEDAGQNFNYRGQFDLVMARAVAPLNVLAEFCLPLLGKGGSFWVLKGGHKQTEEELRIAQKAVNVLGAKIVEVKKTKLPFDEGERTIILMKKTLDTPKKYPRKAGKPAKSPIE
ncbi:16S rRNA (guanine(527)-N(7))-methyltransferase RsmG [Facklamia sp. DSM 111018]|uniref:Ribosomal RNA small subunit methyltransferase G n=1 Tax=Facklamia lactis TaxID=2749967 RepID=A0ABS0LSU4_9LACT|nr:16S rRNA (guanine(527)-N(7))-methyltransferase RsmG [Facklamia lactis]MBG9981291.1 16S rRNA (guanine(527)-N(7))-methyltransferase RsmG [Facklamia lactis]MBG9987232.1 16S rRNA (guanine(527)-N(7))-methyltransferase RsmG [Facklamia lactis]